MSIRSLRRWWQVKTGKMDTPIDGEIPFWIVSLGFHLVVIIFLARIMMPEESVKAVSLMLDEPVEQVVEEDIPMEIQFDELLTEEIGADGDDGFETAAAQAPIIDPISEDTIDLEMQLRDVADIVTDNDFIEATAESMAIVPVKGSVGNSVKAASGAVDRMTQEILMSMQERETIVVWMFDQSASLMEQREEIVQRFDRIYDELGILQAAGHASFENKKQPLLTQVYAFGSEIKPLLKNPTPSLTTIKDAIKSIERDSSGIENVMETVVVAAKDHASYRRIDKTTGKPKNNVMLIIVSDESGDDKDHVNDAIRICNQHQMPVYVIGVPAPFGRTNTEVKWVDPDPEFDQSTQWALVSQGPESIMPERLRLDSTGTFGDLNMIDSGFGPFHLTRLSYETGGIYFAVHPNRNTKRRVKKWETKSYSASIQHFFDPKIMRRYKPDYVSNQTYLARLKASDSRSALVKAATFTTTGTLESPALRFEKLNEATFVATVSAAQQTAAIVEPQINRLYEMLKVGEEARPDEISLRWQAGFDLAIGRAIAAKVRASSYNAMLALIKTKLKFDPPKDKKTPKNNTWVLVPADIVETGSQDTKLLQKANNYLNRVIEEHPGTPWALLAQRELETPIGWKWEQDYTAPPQPREAGPNNNNNNNNAEPRIPQPRMNAVPKTKRPPPKL
ncbi:MAG: VWA domain-containing protein [Mariniblastus sp.]|nr:VWA domain-containing protein [Mariniblastus sp.]MDG2180508.1 VWA domain-containing protein [Mariniblastus sp.]